MGKPKESTQDIIRQAVEAGRLYALPVLRNKRDDDKERLEELRQYGPRGRSKSITRFSKSGVRLTPEEIFEAAVIDLEATIAADEYEIEAMERALATIEKDDYYLTVTGRYIDDLPDERVAELIPCDTTTVWRNRKRLVQRLAVWLYGAEAIK